MKLNRMKLAAASIGALALVGVGVGPAMASSNPQSGSVAISASVAESCGFATFTTSSLDFGALTPGTASAPQSVSYSVSCNDSAGYVVAASPYNNQLTGGLAGSNQTAINNANITDVYTVNGTNSGWGNGVGLSVTNTVPGYPSGSWATTQHTTTAQAQGTSDAYSDAWTVKLPGAAYYPGTFSATIGYAVVGN